jgi:hypothetical protein
VATGRSVQELLRKSPAAKYPVGDAGVTVPDPQSTDHFSASQVFQAAGIAKQYVVASSLDVGVVLGGKTRAVRRLLDPDQQAQFDRGVEHPAADGRHEATGWMVRFDPAKVVLADPRIRVDGSIQVTETGSDELQVTTDHTFVYALRPKAAGATAGTRQAEPRPVLFTVRRELRMRFDRSALRQSKVTLLASAAEAGPQACAADQMEFFQPLFPGGAGAGDAATTGGTDPYDHHRPVVSACGQLAG